MDAGPFPPTEGRERRGAAGPFPRRRRRGGSPLPSSVPSVFRLEPYDLQDRHQDGSAALDGAVVIANPGTAADEVVARFGYRDERELLADLNTVLVCGLPGYGRGPDVGVN